MNGALQRERVNHPLLDPAEQRVVDVEADEFHLAGDTGQLQRRHHPFGGRFVRGEDAVDLFCELVEQIVGGLLRLFYGGSGILV